MESLIEVGTACESRCLLESDPFYSGVVVVDTTTSTTTGRVVPGQRGIRNRHSPFQGRNVQVS